MDDSDARRYERRLHRVFAPDSKPYDGRPVYENLPAYRTPTWLMTGVWMSESSGFEVTPPRPDAAAVRPVEAPIPSTGTRRPAPEIPIPETELMIARGESELPRPSEEQPTPAEPRIEKYRER
jgi:hypothetical protein